MAAPRTRVTAWGGAQVINQCECRAVECMVSSFPACNGGCPDGQECVQAMLKGVTGGGAQVVDQCECREVEGACCWPSGVCTMQTEQSCVDGGATYQGDGIDCADVDCPAECGPSFQACNGDCPAGQDCFESDGATGGWRPGDQPVRVPGRRMHGFGVSGVQRRLSSGSGVRAGHDKGDERGAGCRLSTNASAGRSRERAVGRAGSAPCRANRAV